MPGMSDYDSYDGLGLAELVRKGDVHPTELVEEAISRIERLNPRVNAVINKLYDSAREAAAGDIPDGPFAGVPFLLKDLLIFRRGEVTNCGCRFACDLVSDRDSELACRYRAAGAIVLGRTNAPEFGLMPVTEPELFGPTLNPWDPTRNAGGSSGGSAAAVAMRMVPLAHGNDGGGSIRIPSSCCAVFGLKPTRARVPSGPFRDDVWYGLNCDHVLTRSVRDSAAMLDATAGPDVGAAYWAPPPERPFLSEVGQDPGSLRIAFTTSSLIGGTVHPDCVQGVERTAHLLGELGHDVVEAAPEFDVEPFKRAFFDMVRAEVRADIEELAQITGQRPAPDQLEVNTWSSYLMAKHITSSQLSLAVRQIRATTRQVAQLFERYDVLLTPTLGEPPWLLGALQPAPLERLAMRILGRLRAGRILNALSTVLPVADKLIGAMPFTLLFNATGQPAMSVPLHWNAGGLPIGMQFVGRYGDEATLFRLASQLEQARPWADRLPPLVGE